MSRLIAFDVDSTLLAVESLDFAIGMTRGRDGADRVRAITDAGMSGQMSLRASITARLDIARFDRSEVARAAVALKAHTMPGMTELLSALRERGDRVVAVSGGFADLVRLALRDMGFADGAMFANRFLWDNGTVSGFDTANPLSDNGGKARILSQLRPEVAADSVVMVGDGITDLETLSGGAADRFIGFGGVVRRPAVIDRATEYAPSVQDLSRLLLA